jgi:hypothetical protein
MLERVTSGKRGKARLRLTRRGRKWLHGIALAFLPIITAAGIITEQTAALWATLIGAILVPWIALEDNHSAELELTEHEKIAERDRLEQYQRGLNEGYDAATNHDQGD